MVKAQAVQTSIDVVRAVERAITASGAEPGAGVGSPAGPAGPAYAAVQRAGRELGAYEQTDGPPAPLLRSAGERFVQYSAAILDEISEPTSTMPRPRFAEDQQ
jgi:hypothetical protein